MEKIYIIKMVVDFFFYCFFLQDLDEENDF